MKPSCSATVGQCRAKMKPWKKWAIFASGSFLLVCIAVASLYVAQVNYGVCLKEGRVLSPEELRKRVLVNLVNMEIENAYNSNFFGEDRWLGMADKVTENNARKLLEKAYSDGRSIEEKFGLKPLVKGRKKIKGLIASSDNLKEPFIIVLDFYNAGGLIYISSDIKEIVLNSIGFVFSSPRFFYFPRDFDFIYKNLRGYNNHYFDIRRISYQRECCDNKSINILHGEEYFEKKRRIFEVSMKNLEMNYRTSVASVSNCGDILTEPNDMGGVTKHPDWSYLKKYLKRTDEM